jgi:hypothetical protein
LGGVFRKFAVVAGDSGDVEAGFFGMPDDDFIAGRVDGEPKDIVTAGHVRHGGRGENTDF